jgi:uncharacterized damage-inducible protein DinB
MTTVLSHFKAVEFGRTYLLDALSRISDDLLDFYPGSPGDHRMYTLREQFLHIADIGEMFVYELISGNPMPEQHWRVRRDEDGSISLAHEWATVDDVRRELQRSWDYQDQSVFFLPADRLGQPISKDGNCSAEYIASWLIFHESQHRGQIMTYLRLAGIEPPVW